MKNFIAEIFRQAPLGKNKSSKGRAGSTSDNISHQVVDLGLSVKWATCNVGASAPSEYGDGLAWGETAPKEGYWVANSLTSGQQLGDIAGLSEYDAARALWGEGWRMPTQAEMEELLELCDWYWAKVNGKRGYMVKSRINGNSIFLPTADDRLVYGRYWTSTPYPGSLQDAVSLYFDRGSSFTTRTLRYTAQCVRPVMD